MSRRLRILSIDGGGIRGIVPGQIACRLEQQLQHRTDNPEAYLSDYFDLIAGTSTGGILACALLCPNPNAPTRPRYSAADVLGLYLDRGAEIFHRPLSHTLESASGTLDEKYPAAGLEHILQEYLGDIWLSELIRPCLITSYDIERRRAHFFTSHGAQGAEAQDFLIRDVARATSAAPTYFETVQIRSRTNVSYALIDGGVFANNPALCAYAEVRAGYAKALRITPPARANNMLILSLGTGRVESSYSYEQAKDWGLVNWLRPLLQVIMSGVSETVDYQLQQIYDAVGAPQQYVRIEPHLAPDHVSPDLDNVTDENLIALRDLGDATYEQHEEVLRRFVDDLLENGDADETSS